MTPRGMAEQPSRPFLDQTLCEHSNILVGKAAKYAQRSNTQGSVCIAQSQFYVDIIEIYDDIIEIYDDIIEIYDDIIEIYDDIIEIYDDIIDLLPHPSSSLGFSQFPPAEHRQSKVVAEWIRTTNQTDIWRQDKERFINITVTTVHGKIKKRRRKPSLLCSFVSRSHWEKRARFSVLYQKTMK